MKRKHRTIQLALVFVLLSAGVAWGVSQRNSADAQASTSSQPEQTGRPLTVQAEPLYAKDSLQKNRIFIGMVTAQRQSSLSFELSGKVVRFEVDDGDQVTQNQPLAMLENDRLLAQQKQIEAQLHQAEALLRELQKGPRKQTVESARSLVKEISALRDLAEKKMKRSKKLIKEGAITEQSFEEIYYDYVSLESRALKAQHQLDEYLAGTRQEKVDAQLAVVEELKARLAEIKIEIDDSTLKAPYAGTVVKRYSDEGDVVSPSQPVIDLIENKSLEIRVGIPVESAAVLKLQTEYQFEINHKLYKATLHRVLPILNEKTRTRTALFKFTQPAHEELVNGQIARMKFSENIEMEGFWVPTEALVKGIRGLWSCYALRPEPGDQTGAVYIVERRDVEELYTHEGKMFVTGTIQDGEIIITTGAHRVVPGQRVTWNSPQPVSQGE